MASEDSWAYDLAQKIKGREESNQAATQGFILREKLKRTHGPSLWFELRETLQRRAEALNRAAGKDVFRCDTSDPYKIIGNGRTIASFDSDSLTLQCAWSSTQEKFSVKVCDDDSEVYLVSKTAGTKSVDQIALSLIELNC